MTGLLDWPAAARRRVLFGAACLALASCAGPSPLGEGAEPLEARLSSLELGSAGVFEQTLIVKLRVLNPNTVDAAIAGVDVVLSIDGTRIGRAVAPSDAIAPALGDVVIDAPIVARTDDLLAGVLSGGLSAGAGRYTIEGDLLLSGSNGRVAVRDEGAIPGADLLAPVAP